MTTASLQSVVARCLVDPKFMDAMVVDRSSALAACGLDDHEQRVAERLDLEAIGSLRGLLVKVRHNPLWDVLPATLELLRRARMDLDVFAEHAPGFIEASSQGSMPMAERVRLLVAHLQPRHADEHHAADGHDADRHAVDGRRESGLLADLARHEARCWRLARTAPAGTTESGEWGDEVGPPPGWPQPQPDDVPGVVGRMEVAAYDHDVVAVARWLSTDTGDALPGAEKGGPFAVGYWRLPGPNAPVQLLELDGLSALVLNAANGKRTVADLQRTVKAQLGATAPADGVGGDQVAVVLAEAARQGLIAYRRRHAAGPG